MEKFLVSSLDGMDDMDKNSQMGGTPCATHLDIGHSVLDIGYSLALDRSSPFPSLAVFEGGRIVFSHVWPGELSRAPGWLAETRDLLAAAQIPLDAVASFVCGTGPGSFSGIRACLAAANGLALPKQLPVYGVASAAALALVQAEAHSAECVTVVGDARRNRLWCVTYCVDAARSCVRLADGSVPTHTADDFQLVAADALATVIPEGTRIVSPDWERLATVLQAAFGDTARLVCEPVFPSAEAVGRLALAEPSARRLEPSPVYLHPAV